VDYLYGKITELPIPDASYDALISQFALHDVAVDERAAVVAAWARVVHPAGKLFLREHLGKHGLHVHELRDLLMAGGWQEGAWSTANLPQLGPTYEGMFSC
jgi:ubiquinone/menaquinone biosynthesis C-methylase UbiE